jgi:hypothetical protein
MSNNFCCPSRWLLMTLIIGVFGFSSRVSAEDLSDTFDDPKTLKNWKILEVQGRKMDLYEKIDIGQSRKGWLTIVPRRSRGWYQETMGPMVYKEVEGDFLIETRVMTRSRSAKDQAPQATYNSGGLIVRNPASGPRQQNWVVVNVGKQDPNTGTEVKTTVNSASQLELQEGTHSGDLRLARIGTTIYCLSKLEGKTEWTLIKEFNRRDLPKRVQVGLMANAWGDAGDAIAEYDYVRFSVPKQQSDLTGDSK